MMALSLACPCKQDGPTLRRSLFLRTPDGRGRQRPDLGSQLPSASVCGWGRLGSAGRALCLWSLVRAKNVCVEKLMNERLLWGKGG